MRYKKRETGLHTSTADTPKQTYARVRHALGRALAGTLQTQLRDEALEEAQG